MPYTVGTQDSHKITLACAAGRCPRASAQRYTYSCTPCIVYTLTSCPSVRTLCVRSRPTAPWPCVGPTIPAGASRMHQAPILRSGRPTAPRSTRCSRSDPAACPSPHVTHRLHHIGGSAAWPSPCPWRLGGGRRPAGEAPSLSAPRPQLAARTIRGTHADRVPGHMQIACRASEPSIGRRTTKRQRWPFNLQVRRQCSCNGARSMIEFKCAPTHTHAQHSGTGPGPSNY